MQPLSTQNLPTERDLASLAETSVFGALPETAIHWLLERGTIHRLAAGETLFDKGQPGDSFHVIIEGAVAYEKFHEGCYGYIKDFEVGQQIGFMSLIGLHDRVGRAKARGPTTTLEVNSRVFQAFHDEQPEAFGILMINLAREMARTLRVIDNLLVERSR